MFKSHGVTVRKQLSNVTRITFRNVPLNIPDEEILHLCDHYGKPISDVKYEVMANKAIKGCHGASRYVDMELDPGKQFENFYWLEGPLNGDKGNRITVLHNQQVMQCSNCLRRADNCPGGGRGKACELLREPRGKMADYMQHLKTRIGYTSLKIQYQEKQQQEFPKLGGFGQEENGFARMVEQDIPEQDLEPNDSAEAKDEKIASLEQKLSDFNVVQQKLRVKEEELKLAQKNSRLARNKLINVKKVAEQRMVERLSDPRFKDDYSHHFVNIYASCENPDDYNFNTETDSIEHGDAATLLKDLVENCGMSMKENKDTILFLRNKVIENVKECLKKNPRTKASSVSSIASSTKRKSQHQQVTVSKSSKVADPEDSLSVSAPSKTV